MGDSSELDRSQSALPTSAVYPQLRNWYLARLRQETAKQSALAQMTPIARIELDRLFVEKIVIAATEAPDEVAGFELKPALTPVLPLICLTEIILVCIFYFSVHKGDFVGASLNYYALSLSVLFCGPPASDLADSAIVALSLFGAPLIFANVLPTKIIFKFESSQFSASAGMKFSLLLFLVSIALCAALGLSVQLPNSRLLSCLMAWSDLLLFIYCLQRRLTAVKEHLVLRNSMASIERLLPEKTGQSGGHSDVGDILESTREALKQALARERSIADFSKDLICAFGKDYMVLAVNQSCTNILGFQPQDLLCRHIADLFVEPEWTITERRLVEASDSHIQATFETRVVTARGSLIDLSWLVEWSEREQLYFATARDITIERTVERARQEFVSTISHDVRIPLTALLFGIHSLQQEYHGHLSDGQKAVLKRAEQNNTRVISLLNELIDLEKSVDSPLTLELSEFLVHDLILSGADQLAQQAEQMGVDIVIEGKNYIVKADRDRIERVFINLLSNALKHSPEGQKVTISTVARQRSIEIRVSDKGPGIPKQLQSAVFERYVQLGLPGERGPGGSGLGLAICKALIGAHGSLIGVDSEPGKGTTFWFTLAQSADAAATPGGAPGA